MEDLNKKYWEEMTIKSTMGYCKEMLKLCADPYEKVDEGNFDARCEEYLHNLITWDQEKILKEHLQELKELSPFPEEIVGILHEYSMDGIFQPKHLMCKIAHFRVGVITFEFLIEYGILESDVEIYYGIKAISDSKDTTDEFAESVIELGRLWFEYIQRPNSDRGKNAIDWRLHKFTNNVENGTFWISWARMESKDKMEDIVNNLTKRIFVNFKKFLHNVEDGKWSMVRDEEVFVDRIWDILNNKNADSKEINDHSDLLKILEEACQFKDRNSEKGESILSKIDDKHFQFNCDSATARIFIELLFNKQYFGNLFSLADKFWSLSAIERGKYQNSLDTFIKIHTELSKGESRPIKKRSIDRAWAWDIFRANDGSKFRQNFFNTTVELAKYYDYKRIKLILESGI